MFEFSHDEVAKKKNFVSFFSIMTGNDESGFHSKSVSPLARSTPIEIKGSIYKSGGELSLFINPKYLGLVHRVVSSVPLRVEIISQFYSRRTDLVQSSLANEIISKSVQNILLQCVT